MTNRVDSPPEAIITSKSSGQSPAAAAAARKEVHNAACEERPMCKSACRMTRQTGKIAVNVTLSVTQQ